VAGCWPCLVSSSALQQDAIGVCKVCGGLSCPAHGGKSQTPAGLWPTRWRVRHGDSLLVLGIPVAALSNIGGRDFFRGNTLNAGTETTLPDASAH
jgi:hypothetical protein